MIYLVVISPGSARWVCYRYSIYLGQYVLVLAARIFFLGPCCKWLLAHCNLGEIMKLEIKELDAVPVTGSPGRSMTGNGDETVWKQILWGWFLQHLLSYVFSSYTTFPWQPSLSKNSTFLPRSGVSNTTYQSKGPSIIFIIFTYDNFYRKRGEGVAKWW